MSRLRALALLPLLWLAACASTAPAPRDTSPSADTAAPAHASAASLLLVSLDGVNPAFVSEDDTPNLHRLMREGVHAEWMRPSYPTLTFPNHYTLVTGLRPDRHGIVHNAMTDATLGDFRLSDRDAVGNGDWWNDGEPIWVTAENAGLRTATLAWPGSEAPVRGVRPTHWFPFDASRSLASRVDTVLGWLSEPDATRPRLATLYFEQPDAAGHDFGPHSPELRQAMRDVDAALGRLLDGLDARGLADRIDIVVVSDHGMAEVAADRVMTVEEMVSMAEARIVSAGQVVGVAPNPGFEAVVEARLLGGHDRYTCWRRDAIPERLHYGRHPRVPPIVCQMREGWDAIPAEYLARRPVRTRGSHGYDPDLPSMRAIFIARGPSFRRGVTLPGFDNVDVYPLLARLLGVPAADNDGDPATLLPALRGDAAR
ncbi:ectonucleotide pyrophosphatase/phosphodiesterase [Luteimonas sp. BDR2-5]|uniref:alkaline phosphatase family protein n=1 Tax=Proluteimonas luteida TaxID=2878685 RepID=UPI001E310FBD|nr:ectonucleotide pyrophosphatase/phosphodiesterase [Luteimonas sp. BDR2-5]MCD9028250.1 ectonucleotide pyrophosphatase/phosphodiesterase [Luteimonas sp. BDR2-5]